MSPPLQISASRLFTSWLAGHRASLAFTTYQAGKLFMLGLKDDGSFAVFNRSLARVMGMAVHGDSLWVATLWQLWRFENVLQPGELHAGHDRYYVPQLAYTTGDIDVHDVAVDGNGEPLFVSTLFSCLARPDPRFSLRPVWKPPFVSRYAAEDRCHLNGLAMEDGRAAYVTCVARADANEGWREHRVGGGLVIDVRNDELVCTGLSMPHSPRVHDGRLWLLNSGSGELGYVDRERGRFEPIAFCPGYVRGLAFLGDYAIVGLSGLRKDKGLGGLPLEAELEKRGVAARCAVQVVDLKRGDVVHEVRIEGVVEELFDVAVLPGARNPAAVGFLSDEVRHTISLPPDLE